MTCDGRKSIRGSCKMQTYQQRAQVSVKRKYITGGSIVKTGVVHWHVYFVRLIHMSSLKFSIAKKYLTSIFIFDFVIKRLKFSFFNKCQRLHLLYVPTEHVIILHLSREFYNLSHERKLLSKSILFWFSSAVLLEKVSNTQLHTYHLTFSIGTKLKEYYLSSELTSPQVLRKTPVGIGHKGSKGVRTSLLGKTWRYFRAWKMRVRL